MPLVFSYGTLQQASVQLATYGRYLEGKSDALPGFRIGQVEIRDAGIMERSGMTHYQNVHFTGEPTDLVEGMVFELTDAEIAATDLYEQQAAYKRFKVVLLSGTGAWVYAEQKSVPFSDEGKEHE